ncbi:hypothetical protein [Paenibacillus sp. Pae108]|uniref:hypothetical protein n=1 Tax=Paenibacillus sp. Pae108 TaxID=2926019 RepID=UPI002118AF9B|nr:hypothetical protein [Paenibacillus sp. Pae108]
MSYSTKPLITAQGSLPAPQKWDQAGDQYRPFTGGAEIQNGFKVGAVSVGTTSAIELKAEASAMPNRRKMILRVSGNDAVYIGPTNTVNSTTGYPLLPGDKFDLTFDPMVAVPVYAIAASGSQIVRIFEVN